jgi:SAM-dependent methyltransferase
MVERGLKALTSNEKCFFRRSVNGEGQSKSLEGSPLFILRFEHCWGKPALAEAKTLFEGRKGHFENIIRRHIAVPKGTRILGLGCGHGVALYFLQRHGYTQVSGVDGFPEQVELARELGIAGVELGDLMEYLAKTPDGAVGVVLAMDI